MPRSGLRSLIPTSFYGRAILILLVPILTIQIVLSAVFIQRHYDNVTTQMTANLMRDVNFVVSRIDDAPSVEDAIASLSDILQAMQFSLTFPVPEGPDLGHAGRGAFDIAGAAIIRTFEDRARGYVMADLVAQPGQVRLWVDTVHGMVEMTIPRRLLTTSNPHQLLVIVFLTALLMTALAVQFLRLQVRPIRRLGEAAEAYGRGESLPFVASGAREIRATGLAFIDMRNRIDRQNAQRKLMLSGISHDMRTPLTRMRLILSMMEDGEDRTALETEIADLEKLLTGFLDYAAGQSHAAPETVDLPDLVQGIVARNAQGGRDVRWLSPDTHLPPLLLRRELIVRALDNLIANALRHGRRADVALVRHPGKIVLSVDDDGPGIPQADRDRATEPFVRLDEARNRDSGSGVGLGLAIVAEAMRLHRGKLVLNDSATLGGLRAELHLPLGEGYNR